MVCHLRHDGLRSIRRAFLVEMFDKIRYTSMSLPYHIRNEGVFGLVPLSGAADSHLQRPIRWSGSGIRSSRSRRALPGHRHHLFINLNRPGRDGLSPAIW